MKKFLYITFAFILCFTAVIPVSYATSVDDLPELELPSSSSIGVIFEQSSGSIWASVLVDGKDYLVSTIHTEQAVDNPNSISLLFSEYIDTLHYKYENSNWVLKSSNSNNYFNFHCVTILRSDVDILNEDGTVFFPLPPTELHQIIQGVTNQNLPQTQATVVGAMRILVLCGVGCLALLMVFPLFGKVLKRYLPR